jgi:hypothetical protein
MNVIAPMPELCRRPDCENGQVWHQDTMTYSVCTHCGGSGWDTPLDGCCMPSDDEEHEHDG